jgi:RIH domain
MVNNRTFFQHPDLIRVLRNHENVMAVMMNTLGRRAQAQSDLQAKAVGGEGEAAAPKEKVKVTLSEHTTLKLCNLRNAGVAALPIYQMFTPIIYKR